MSDITVHAKPVDQPWETIGRDTAAGIGVENPVLEWDECGPSTIQLDLKRDALTPWPDIGTLADLVIDTPTVKAAWEGEVAITPRHDGEDRVVSVQGRGAQAELDDDVVEKTWVHNLLGEWQDMRGVPDAALGSGASQAPAACTVDTSGSITLTIPKGTVLSSLAHCGVVLDLGPNRTGRRVSMTYTQSNNDSACQVVVGAGDTDGPWAGWSDNAIAFLNNAGAGPTTTSGSFAADHRYVGMILRDTGAGHTLANDVWLKVSAFTVYNATAYESGNASILKGSTVISDALDLGTLVMSTDRSQITTSSTSFPAMACEDTGNTTREVIQKVNALHDWVFKVKPGRIPAWYPKPTVATMEIGAWSPKASDEDASSNDIGEIVNRVVVRGTAPDGTPVRVERTTPALSDAIPEQIGAIAGTTSAGNDVVVSNWFPGPIRQGGYYTLDLTTGGVGTFRLAALSVGSTSYSPLPGGVASFTYSFYAPADAAFATIQLRSTGPGSVPYSLKLNTAKPTVLDKRGRRRTKVLTASWPLPSDGVLAAALGDAYLNTHKLTPFKGTCTVVGNQSVRDPLTGDYIPLDQVGQRTMELVRFSDRRDPDSGAWCREGRLVNVKWMSDDETAELTIDNTSARFDALLARLGVQIGQG